MSTIFFIRKEFALIKRNHCKAMMIENTLNTLSFSGILTYPPLGC